MIEIYNLDKLKQICASVNTARKKIETFIQSDQSTLHLWCCYCEDVTEMSLQQSDEEWIDLRGELLCSSCKLVNRDRLLLKAMKHESIPSDVRGLIFEKVTNLFDKLGKKYSIEGVEFGGYSLTSGQKFYHNEIELIHQNLESTSYNNSTFDYIIHSDVLEHVDKPYKAIKECMRVLKPNGTLLFATPIYTNQMFDRTTANLSKNNDIVFVGDELYHGDPLNDKGVPVFTLFGWDIIDRINQLGFECSYLLDHSLLEGIFSNNNPYYNIGHMWPIVIKVKHRLGV